MKRTKGLRSLIILISLFVFLFPAYSCYFALVETNLSSSDMSYENPDQDGLSMNAQSEFKGFTAFAPPIAFSPVDNLSKWRFDSSYQTISIYQRSFVLRC